MLKKKFCKSREATFAVRVLIVDRPRGGRSKIEHESSVERFHSLCMGNDLNLYSPQKSEDVFSPVSSLFSRTCQKRKSLAFCEEYSVSCLSLSSPAIISKPPALICDQARSRAETRGLWISVEIKTLFWRKRTSEEMTGGHDPWSKCPMEEMTLGESEL